MEDPNSRPPIAAFIDHVIHSYYETQRQGYIGWSLAMTIYDALKREGFLKEE